ncbi:MAG: nucleotide exchange factor GrpE [Fimbriiglobus sp.]
MPENEDDFAPNVDLPNGEDSEALRLKVGQLEKQIGDYKILIADFENSRKRLAQDADRQRKYAIEPLVKDMLTAFDNLDFAAKAAQATKEDSSLTKGVTATIQQMLDIFKRHGVHRIDVGPGSPFDPNLHQAVMEQPTTDHPAGSVVNVMQQGFLLHDRVIRPASVIVASAGE